MSGLIRQLCALSVLCGVALLLTPEGSGRRALAVCCSVLLSLSVLTAFGSFDFDAYSLELARYRDMGDSLADEAEERSRRLNKTLIMRQLEEYIRTQAEELGMSGLRAEPSVRWSTEGFWVPESVRLTGDFDAEREKRLREIIAADLGIPAEKQEWVRLDDEQSD